MVYLTVQVLIRYWNVYFFKIFREYQQITVLFNLKFYVSITKKKCIKKIGFTSVWYNSKIYFYLRIFHKIYQSFIFFMNFKILHYYFKYCNKRKESFRKFISYISSSFITYRIVSLPNAGFIFRDDEIVFSLCHKISISDQYTSVDV